MALTFHFNLYREKERIQMENDILSKAEDEYFSSVVIAYNQNKNTTKKERDFILQRTKKLIYLICRDRLFVNRDLLSSIYINMSEDIEKIISSYRIASRSFNYYLKQVCSYRIRRVKKKEASHQYMEIEYSCENGEFYTTDNHLDNEDDGNDIPLSEPMVFYNPIKFSDMDIKDICSYIIDTNNRDDYILKNEKEEELASRLSKSLFRRNFLFFILSLPTSEGEREVENYARVFKTDVLAFSRLIHLKHDFINSNNHKREKNLQLAAMHWRIMAKIKNSMYSASSETEYNELKDNYMAQVRCHKNRLDDARRSFRGIIHEDIASTLGHSRTTVSMGIRQVRKALMEISAALSRPQEICLESSTIVD